MAFVRKHLSALSAVAIMTLLVGAPAIAAGINADTVDKLHAVKAGATLAQKKGKLVATSPTTGKLPTNIMSKSPDSAKLDGKLPGAYTLDTESVEWARLLSVPADLADGDQIGPTYVGGLGIDILGDQINANLTTLQARVAGSCPVGQSIRAIAGDGNVTCQTDSDSGGDITAVSAGPGLSGGGTAGNVTVSVANDSINALMLASGSVVGGFFGDIQDGSIAAADLGSNSVSGGAGGVVTDGSITSSDLGTDSVGNDELANGSVQGGFSGTISDSTITSDDLADNSVNGGEITNGTITDIDISDALALSIQSVATTASVAVGTTLTVTGSSTFSGPVTVNNNVSITGNVTGSNFMYGSPKEGEIYIDPTQCQRAGGPPYQDMDTFGTHFVRGVRISNPADGTYGMVCPASFSTPPGATVTITDATAAFRDTSATCLLSAELWSHTFGGEFGNPRSSETYSGATSNDYAFTSPGTVLKPLGGVAPFVLLSSQVIWIDLTQQNSGGGGNCFFRGARIGYTVDRA
jgi:hypothetical protein